METEYVLVYHQVLWLQQWQRIMCVNIYLNSIRCIQMLWRPTNVIETIFVCVFFLGGGMGGWGGKIVLSLCLIPSPLLWVFSGIYGLVWMILSIQTFYNRFFFFNAFAALWHVVFRIPLLFGSTFLAHFLFSTCYKRNDPVDGIF